MERDERRKRVVGAPDPGAADGSGQGSGRRPGPGATVEPELGPGRCPNRASGDGPGPDAPDGPPQRHPPLVAAREERGQATAEYALLLAASLAMVLALGAIYRAASTGVLVDKAEQAASHSREVPLADALKDVLLY